MDLPAKKQILSIMGSYEKYRSRIKKHSPEITHY
jgi:hypothetical protein